MEDESIFTKNQPKVISEGLQNFIDSMMEEIVLEGKPFKTQKKYLKKFSVKEGVDYNKLEANITSLIDMLDNLKATFSDLQLQQAEDKARECHISEGTMRDLVKHSLEQKNRLKKKQLYPKQVIYGLGGLLLLSLIVFLITKGCGNNDSVIHDRDTVMIVQHDTIVKIQANNIIKPSVAQRPKGLEAVDLGLPSGTKWANMNLGATSPEDNGGYYAWGEIEEKYVYSKDTYFYYDHSSKMHYYLGESISGTKYDVAREKWGGSWQIPTSDQMQELRKECKYKLDHVNGVKGYRFTGPNGKSIFLPAAGYYEGEEKKDYGEYGVYWSGEPNKPHSTGFYSALCLCFQGNELNLSFWWREDGHSVRPVSKSNSHQQNSKDERPPK